MDKAVVAVNYGGPSLGREKEYLKRLFSDEVLFPLPKPFRDLLGSLIATFRWKETRDILLQVGGKSPLMAQTEEQVKLLSRRLRSWDFKIAMRYSPPLLEEVLKEVENYPKVVIFPLFPHYSSATYGTTERVVRKVLNRKVFFTKPFYNCYQFVKGWVKAIEESLQDLKNPFLLFSAHSLPLYLVKKYKDPYPLQVQESARLIAERLKLPWRVSYQSKVGPIRWLSPSTEEAIKKLANRGVKELVVIPISFVSENTETLQEIDLSYASLARREGIENFKRVKIPYKNLHWLECWENLIKGT